MSADLDYDVLASNLMSTVESMSAYQIKRTSVEIPSETQVFCGGYGNVRCVKYHEDGAQSVDVALKELRPAGDKKQCLRVAVSLAREVGVWSKLQHPNIVALVGFYLDLETDVAWLLSPWEPFGNIVTYLGENDVDQATRLKLALDTAQGLNYLHTLEPPVYHGDVKGVNVLVSHDRRAKWCDFGLAKVVGDVPSGLTTSQNMRGTTCYFSPELLDESSQKTLNSDVWAWGCVFIQVLVGRIPYESEGNEAQVIAAIMEEKTPAPLDDDSIPVIGKEIAARCWSTEPAARPTMAWCADKLSREIESQASWPNSGDTVQARIRHEWTVFFLSSLSSQLGGLRNLFRAIGSSIVMTVKRSLAWGWLLQKQKPPSGMLEGEQATREGPGVSDNGLRMPVTMSTSPDAGSPSDYARPLPSAKPRSDTDLTNLAVGLYRRYKQRGDAADLGEAISLLRKALELRPSGHSVRVSTLNHLGICLLLRYGGMGDGEDLAEAISMHQESLELCPAGHPDRGIGLSSLASCLSARYDQLGDPTDLAEAIRLQQESSNYQA